MALPARALIFFAGVVWYLACDRCPRSKCERCPRPKCERCPRPKCERCPLVGSSCVCVLWSGKVRGMCHRSQAADQKMKDLTEVYDEGDLVKAIVLKVS